MPAGSAAPSRPLAQVAERACVALAATLPLLVLSLHELWTMRVPSVVPSDGAIAEIATRSAIHLQRFVGPYSRFRWDHPGPAVYYWFAPFFEASNQYHGGLSAAAAVLNLVCAVAIVAAVWRAAGRRAALASVAAVLLFLALVGVERSRSLWNPDMVILPIAVTFVAAAALIGGRRWALPLLAVAASFAVQTHVGTTPVVLAVTVTAVVAWLVLERAALGRWLRSVLVASGAVVVFWALPVYQQLTHTPGNLGVIVNYFSHSASTPQPLREVARYVVLQTTLAGVPKRYIGALEGPLPHASPARLAIAAAVLAAVVLGLVRAVQRRDRFNAGLRGLLLASLPASAYAVRNVDGVLFPYLTTFTLGVGVVMWIAALGTVAEAGAALLQRLASRLVVAARLGTVAILLVVAVVVAASWRHIAPVAPQVTNPAVTMVADAIKPRVDPHKPLLVSLWVNDTWMMAAGVVDTLERQGYTVDVNAERVFMFGQDHAPTRDDAHRFVLTLTGSVPVVPGTFQRVALVLPDWAPKIELYEVPAGVPLNVPR